MRVNGLDLSLDSIRSFPANGWNIKGKKILPPNAFTSEENWIISVKELYSEIVSKIILIIDKEKKGSITYQYLIRHAVLKLINKLNREINQRVEDARSHI